MIRQRGFTLLEMAVVLVIVGLLLGGLLNSLGALQAHQREEQTRHDLEEIREALITFAVVNKRLPCPAAPATADTVVGAGLERVPTVAGCTGGASGVLPWATLGLPPLRDGSGTCLWYERTGTTARVIAAGAPTAGQTRTSLGSRPVCGGNNSPANYVNAGDHAVAVSLDTALMTSRCP